MIKAGCKKPAFAMRKKQRQERRTGGARRAAQHAGFREARGIDLQEAVLNAVRIMGLRQQEKQPVCFIS